MVPRPIFVQSSLPPPPVALGTFAARICRANRTQPEPPSPCRSVPAPPSIDITVRPRRAAAAAPRRCCASHSRNYRASRDGWVALRIWRCRRANRALARRLTLSPASLPACDPATSWHSAESERGPPCCHGHFASRPRAQRQAQRVQCGFRPPPPAASSRSCCPAARRPSCRCLRPGLRRRPRRTRAPADGPRGTSLSSRPRSCRRSRGQPFVDAPQRVGHVALGVAPDFSDEAVATLCGRRQIAAPRTPHAHALRPNA